MAFVLKNIPQKRQNLKHAISLFTGLFMLRFVYGIDCLHGIMSATVTYLICLTVPRKHVHIYVFIWAMGYMTLSHLYRMTYFYMVDQFDFTRTQMVLTMKLTSFAFSLYDGSCDNANKRNSSNNSCDSISNSCNNQSNNNNDDNSNTNNNINANNINSNSNSNSKNTSNGGNCDVTDLLVNESVIDSAIQSVSLSPSNASLDPSINPIINKAEINPVVNEYKNDNIDTSNHKNDDRNENENKNRNQDILSRKARLSHRISESRTEYAITHLPTPLEFGGYVFCFPNLLAGPAFVYVDYIQGMNHRWRTVRREEEGVKGEEKKVMEGEETVGENVGIEKKEESTDKGDEREEKGEKEEIAKNEKEDDKMINSNSNFSSTTTNSNNKNKINSNDNKNDNEHVIVSSTVAALHRLSVGLLCLILYFIISSKTPISRQYDIQWQNTHHFLHRLAFISISFLGERFKFYFAWKVSEGACIMAGFGLQEINVNENRDDNKVQNRNENRNDSESENVNRSIIEKKNELENKNDDESKQCTRNNNVTNESDNMRCSKIVSNIKDNSNDNNSNNSILDTVYNIIGLHTQTHTQSQTKSQYVWRGVENVDIIAYECSTNIQSLSRSWNKRTQSWLEQYVYNRTEQSLLTTYTVSALWHGLYPGYFMFFFSAALMSSTERLVRKKINPLILISTSSPLYNTQYCVITRGVYTVLCWFLTSVTLTYHAQTFYMKSFSRSMQAFESFYYIPNIAFLLFYCVLYFAPTPTPTPTPVFLFSKTLNGEEENEYKGRNDDKNKIKNENENENVGVTMTKIKSL